MEFVIARNDLVRELQTVTGVVEKRATLPILANLLLETQKDGIRLGTSDLEITIRGTAKATVVREGGVTLPAGKLHEIARSLPDAEVQFKLMDRNQVKIECERIRYRISGLPRDEFPKFPQLDLSQGIKLPGSALRDMVDRVTFAITTEDPRYSLNGALFLLEKGRITLVATDGHRLAYVSRETSLEPPGGEIKVVVPKKTMAELSKLMADLGKEDEVSFGKVGNHMFFAVGSDHVLTSTILEGNFPVYQKVMPEECEIEIVLPTDNLGDAVRRVSLLAADRLGKAIRLGLTPGKLEIFSGESDMGEAQETLAVDYDGPEMEIGFNSRYLLDFLAAVDTASVHLDLGPKDPKGEAKKSKPGDKPGQFRPEPARGLDYRYIVMPMHL